MNKVTMHSSSTSQTNDSLYWYLSDSISRTHQKIAIRRHIMNKQHPSIETRDSMEKYFRHLLQQKLKKVSCVLALLK